ncbi:hypothetical protein [Streptomyces sp. NPDC005385]|uniref:hypothetical protein n=1 Tax=Streptomyces sp. NPDC005385 TaxID=3157039 RepID=UPI0033A4609A
MAEYQVSVSYETNDGGVIVVDFDLTPGEAGLSGQNKETLVQVVAQAIADTLETVVVNTPNATLNNTNAKRFYAAVESLTLV